eukprot:COSAG02_NODE_7453_length_3007_cov_1.343879_1_plen_129_part_00
MRRRTGCEGRGGGVGGERGAVVQLAGAAAAAPPLGACFLLPRLSACRPALPAAALIRTYRYRRGADVLRDLLAVKLNANRNVTGNLRGFDQFMNIVLDNTVEEVSETERNDMGLVVRAQPRAEAFLSG